MTIQEISELRCVLVVVIIIHKDVGLILLSCSGIGINHDNEMFMVDYEWTVSVS